MQNQRSVVRNSEVELLFSCNHDDRVRRLFLTKVWAARNTTSIVVSMVKLQGCPGG